MLPLAPARLSTTTVCRSASLIGVATRRATKSSPPPAPEATITLIGLFGYPAGACAAECVATGRTSAATNAVRNFQIIDLLMVNGIDLDRPCVVPLVLPP